MQLRHWLIVAASAAALGFIAMPSQAAPVGALDGLRAGGENEVQQVHRRYRKYRHYRHHRRYYGYGPGVHFYIGPRHRHYRRHHQHY
jgi:hypothetical protein